jgi:hypothetical protein
MNNEEQVDEVTGEVLPGQANGQNRVVQPDAGYSVNETFAGTTTTAMAETSSTGMAAKAKALVEARYSVAIARPRDINHVRVQILKACKRPAFAKVARYRKPIGKDGVFGLGIRFAEEAMRCMGNTVADVSLVYEDNIKRVFSVSVTDLEANTPWSTEVPVEKTVERKFTKKGQQILGTRINSYGEPVFIIPATEDDMLNKQNALISKALRTNILRIVPGDILDEATSLIIATQENEDAKDPDAARKSIIYSFSVIGVMPKDLNDYLGHDIAQATPAELGELRAIGLAIKDGEASWSDTIAQKRGGVAPTAADGGAPKTVKDAVAAVASKTKPATPPPDSKPAANETKPAAAETPTPKAETKAATVETKSPDIDPAEQAAAEAHFAKEAEKKAADAPKQETKAKRTREPGED